MIPSMEGEGVGERASYIAKLSDHKVIDMCWKRWHVVSSESDPRHWPRRRPIEVIVLDAFSSYSVLQKWNKGNPNLSSSICVSRVFTFLTKRDGVALGQGGVLQSKSLVRGDDRHIQGSIFTMGPMWQVDVSRVTFRAWYQWWHLFPWAKSCRLA